LINPATVRPGRSQIQRLIGRSPPAVARFRCGAKWWSTASNLSAQGPILPINAELLALSPISPFHRWRGVLLPNSAFVVLEGEERPVAAAADHVAVHDVRCVEVLSDKTISMRMLFDPGSSRPPPLRRSVTDADHQHDLTITGEPPVQAAAWPCRRGNPRGLTADVAHMPFRFRLQHLRHGRGSRRLELPARRHSSRLIAGRSRRSAQRDHHGYSRTKKEDGTWKSALAGH
jgi:hypothetical protein